MDADQFDLSPAPASNITLSPLAIAMMASLLRSADPDAPDAPAEPQPNDKTQPTN